MRMQRKRTGIVLGMAFFAALLLGVSVAAEPAIAVSATRQGPRGEYVIVNGQGFPANQPMQASLIAQNQVFPLVFQDLTLSVNVPQPVPMTDSTGAFQDLAFALPPPGRFTGTTGEVFISVGSAMAHIPVAIDPGIATTVGRGDTIAVSIGAAALAVAVLLILLLLRGLPVYPLGQKTQTP